MYMLLEVGRRYSRWARCPVCCCASFLFETRRGSSNHVPGHVLLCTSSSRWVDSALVLLRCPMVSGILSRWRVDRASFDVALGFSLDDKKSIFVIEASFQPIRARTSRFYVLRILPLRFGGPRLDLFQTIHGVLWYLGRTFSCESSRYNSSVLNSGSSRSSCFRRRPPPGTHPFQYFPAQFAALGIVGVLLDDSVLQLSLFCGMHALSFLLVVFLKPFANWWERSRSVVEYPTGYGPCAADGVDWLLVGCRR